MDPNTLNILKGAAGAAGGDKVYVEDVFSTDLWIGNETERDITNGIDLDGEGGMVWLRGRTSTSRNQYYALFDTKRGANEWLRSDDDADSTTVTEALNDFNSNGFTIGTSKDTNALSTNENYYRYVSWTFREAKGFFDVIQFEGTGSAQNIDHGLGCIPGCIMIKNIDNDEDWHVYHKHQPNSTTEVLYLNDNRGQDGFSTGWDSTAPTKEQFTVGNDDGVNKNGDTFIAYLFADGADADAQIFGDDGDESIIKCGVYTGEEDEVDCGFEPQWVILKRIDGNGNWSVFDTMRGAADDSNRELAVDIYDDEQENNNVMETYESGFRLLSTSYSWNGSGDKYAYIAIRRGPMKKPEDATEVFNVGYGLDASTNGKVFNAPFPVDLNIGKDYSSNNGQWYVFDRLRGGGKYHCTDSKDVQGTLAYQDQFDHMDGLYTSTSYDYTDWIGYQFKRAPGFFDMVNYSGDGNSGRTISHNLNAIPQMIIIKRYANDNDNDEDWAVGHEGITLGDGVIYLNRNTPISGPVDAWDDTAPTDSVITLGDWQGVNSSSNNSRYIAYLFGSLDGVSKVGSVAYSGSAINVDCGFTAGARFVMFKRTDDNGNWLVYDTTRGINTGANDPFLQMDVVLDEDSTKDYIDPLTTGFKFNASTPLDDGDYIYLAIA